MARLWLLSLVFLSACATTPSHMGDVAPGMTTEQVRDRLGDPADRTFKGKRQHWTYSTKLENKTHNKLIIFEDGKVVELLNTKPNMAPMHQADSGAQQTPSSDTQYCDGSNPFGKFPKGGGCNLYGCWAAGGYCNGFGCTSSGRCTAQGCPKETSSYLCQDQ